MAIINGKIIAWAARHLRQRVGQRGQCWDLVEQAVTGSGGISSRDLGPIGDNADYIWGDAVTPATSAVAGDILQFRDYALTIPYVDVVTYGSLTPPQVTNETGELAGRSYDHHSAIIETIAGNVTTVLEQNAPPAGQVVQRTGGIYLATTVVTDPPRIESRDVMIGQQSTRVSVSIVRTTTFTVANPPLVYRAKTP